MPSKIATTCPTCDVKLSVPEKHAGKNLRCPKCKSVVPVPKLSALAPESDIPKEDKEDDFAFGNSVAESIKPRKRKLSADLKPVLLILSVLGFSVLLIGILVFNSPPSMIRQKTPEEARTARIKNHFRAWDGSHNGLTKVIQEAMHDPNSYEHVETRYADRGGYLIVTTTFRGKNAFGGVVKNSVTAKVDLDGNVIEVLSKSP